MEKNDAFYKSFPFTLITVALVSTILWLVFGKMYGVGFALGGTTSMFMMSMLHRSSKKVVEQDEFQAKRLATRNYFFRYFFYALILLAAGLLDNIDLLTTGIGLFTFKIVFYIVILLEKRRGEDDDVSN
ncbi:ATP synthase I chain [Candidatus Izimaplasma bacterium HR1]|jgi:membrane protein YqaA with SNARE-associated domain|uniref:ATP synthase subunit I n=1 Tax=Candidatus Izimoplasma sp. HR1 TaxID=1541959 RepID=UPI0004F6959D|nr:ATP synthase I chain [Candidatus Izimaplasma bacterium HR1]